MNPTWAPSQNMPSGNLRTYPNLYGRKWTERRPAQVEVFCSPFAPHKVLQPSWIAFDNVVLRFFAYFQEPIPESPLENHRVHHVHIRYYCEDDTIDVFEPPTYDAAFPQGKLIQRAKVPLPTPSPCPCTDAHFYTLDHLNVGCHVEFYGKTFFIVGCNADTRRFLNRRGVAVGLNMEPPSDEATERRKEARLHVLFTKKPGVEMCRVSEKSMKFLENRRKVLRFWGYWDDRCSYKGILRKFVFLFHLEDGTLEITEILDGESGDVNPLFFRRQRLLKNPKDFHHLPGFTDEAFEVLNTSQLVDVCGNRVSNAYLPDRLYTGGAAREVYEDKDFAIGAVINVYGRAFVMTQMDAFTEAFYRDKYGVQDFTPLVLHEPPLQCQVPGLGETFPQNEGDTRATNTKDLRSLFLDKDVVVFSACFPDAQHKVNSEREFRLKYFLTDASFQVHEHSHPNSGFPQGLFLARSHVEKPRGPHLPSTCPAESYDPRDIHVGNTVDINGFQFLLLHADEATLSLMEHHPLIFPQSNVCEILSKVREAFGPHQSADVLLAFSANDCEKMGVMSGGEFRCLLLDLTKRALNDHEVTTLTRAYRVTHPPPPPDMHTLQAIIQTELKRFHFDRTLLQRLEYTLRHCDACRSGLVERHVLRQVLKGGKIPMRAELTDFLVDHFPSSDSTCRVNYCQVLAFLDWESKEIPDAKPAPIECIMQHVSPQPPAVVSCVNYRAFLEDVSPNFRCSLASVCCPCPGAECAEQAEAPRSSMATTSDDQGAS